MYLHIFNSVYTNIRGKEVAICSPIEMFYFILNSFTTTVIIEKYHRSAAAHVIIISYYLYGDTYCSTDK